LLKQHENATGPNSSVPNFDWVAHETGDTLNRCVEPQAFFYARGDEFAVRAQTREFAGVRQQSGASVRDQIHGCLETGEEQKHSDVG
jgi:hypothetical protein